MGGRGRAAALAVGALLAFRCGKASERSGVPPPGQPASEPAPTGGPDPFPAGDTAPPQARVVGTGNGPLVLASDADRIYWGTTAREGAGPVIQAADKNGGPAVTLAVLPRRLDLPGAVDYSAWIDTLQVDANWIFFLVEESQHIRLDPHEVASVEWLGTFYRVPKSGGTAEPFIGPEGFVLMHSSESEFFSVAIPAEDDAVYYYHPRPFDFEAPRPVLDLAAVPKGGGVPRAIHLQLPDRYWFGIGAVAADANYWYLSHDTYAGSEHGPCVARAPKAGGVVEDVWCPGFPPRHLELASGRLFGVDWEWDSMWRPGQAFWALDIDTRLATAVARWDTSVAQIAVDAAAANLYAIEYSYESEEFYPVHVLKPAVWDVVHVDVASGRRRLLHRGTLEPERSGSRLIVDERAIFFAHEGQVLRVDR